MVALFYFFTAFEGFVSSVLGRFRGFGSSAFRFVGPLNVLVRLLLGV